MRKGPPYPNVRRKRRLNGAVSWNNRKKVDPVSLL